MNDTTEDPDVIRAYLAGRLSEADNRAFEERCEREPTLVRTMEDTLRFKEGLEVLRERGQLARLLRSPKRPLSQWLIVTAAAAGLATVVVLAGLQFFARPPIVSASLDRLGFAGGAEHAIAGHYAFAAMRQAGRSPDVELPVGGAIELRVLPSAVDAAKTYRSTLESVPRDGAPVVIGTVMHLIRDADGFVAIYADAARLAPGNYAISVTAEPAEGTTPDRYPFTLRSPDGRATP